MIDLFTAATGNGRRAAIMLEECGLAYKTHKIDLTKGDQKQPEFLKMNPAGAIPVIVDHEGPGGRSVTISQSGAIVLYLADKTGKFLPKDPVRRAHAYEWFMQAATDIAPASSTIFYVSSVVPEKTPSTIQHFETRFLNMCGVVDQRLIGRDYLVDEISIADLALVPVVAARKEMIDKQAGLANLKRWAAAMLGRPGVTRGLKVPA
ncbi:MAG: glutathione S-transferase [Proteobacteria bacterium]|nr:glutathione S-transferase [Pseudomonadota bacterium]